MSTESPASPHEPRVLVFPFAPTGDVGSYQWIGRGIQQSLQADLSRSGNAQVIFPATQPTPNTPVNPIEMARSANANVVVIGSYQVAGNDVRITGTVYDVGTVRDLGGLKATGPATDIFKLEDQLNDQLTHVLPSGYTEASAKPLPSVQYGSDSGAVASNNAPASAAPATATSSVNVTTAQPPDVTYNYINTPTSSLAYDSPYYYPSDYYAYGGYPYFYNGPFVGFVGIYGGGFYGRGFGYGRGYGFGGYGHPYYGGGFLGPRGGFGGGFHPGFAGGGFGGGFHGGGFHGGGFGGGGFGGGGHR